jgi:hypothetical protein
MAWCHYSYLSMLVCVLKLIKDCLYVLGATVLGTRRRRRHGTGEPQRRAPALAQIVTIVIWRRYRNWSCPYLLYSLFLYGDGGDGKARYSVGS